jgi:hypothetical protein
MSVQITAKIICDDCGAAVSGEVETKSTYAKRAYWSALGEAKKRNWMLLARGHNRTRKHYCNSCAVKHISLFETSEIGRNIFKYVVELSKRFECDSSKFER